MYPISVDLCLSTYCLGYEVCGKVLAFQLGDKFGTNLRRIS